MKKKCTLVASCISAVLFFICIWVNLFNILIVKDLMDSGNSGGIIDPGTYAVFADVTLDFNAILNVLIILMLLMCVGLVFSLWALAISLKIEKYKKSTWVIFVLTAIEVAVGIIDIFSFVSLLWLPVSLFTCVMLGVCITLNVIDLVNNKKHLRQYYYKKSFEDTGLVVDTLNVYNQPEVKKEYGIENNQETQHSSSLSSFNDTFKNMQQKENLLNRYKNMLDAGVISKREYDVLVNSLKNDKNT